MPRYHPEDEVLFDYVTGALDEATSLLVATHLVLCPHCRGVVKSLEAVGGALLEGLDEPVLAAMPSVSASGPDRAPVRCASTAGLLALPGGGSIRVPRPLAA